MNLRIVFLLVLTLPVNATTGQENDTELELNSMIPADLYSPKKPLHKQIEYPENTDNRTVFVKCETIITRNGNFSRVVCYPLEGSDNKYFESAILAGFRQADAQPAIIERSI